MPPSVNDLRGLTGPPMPPIRWWMARCIYCTATLLARGSTADTRRQTSLEHIVPLALGGSDDLATPDCCRGCNNDLGATVDSALLHDVLVVMERQRFRLTGHSGRIPELRMDGHSLQTGVGVTMRVSGDLDVEWHARPKVNRTENPGGTTSIHVEGSPEDALRILSGIKQSAEARGERMLGPDGVSIDDLEASVRAAAEDAPVTTEYRVHATHDPVAIRRGLAKIAFGFAHLALGPDWTFDTRAEAMRRMARGLSSRKEVLRSASDLSDAMRGVLLGREKEADIRHLVALLPMGEESIILVSLFGKGPLSLAFPLSVSEAQLVSASRARRPAMVSLLPGRGDVQWEMPERLIERLVAGSLLR